MRVFSARMILAMALPAVVVSPAWAQNESGETSTPATPVVATTAPKAQPTVPQAAQEPSGDIIVTARRRSENIEKVPISITAISSSMLREKQITSEIDLQSAVPGLTIRQSGSANQFNFALRGQSVDTYSGSPPAVLTYIDDVQIAQTSASTFYDLAGIQVLKGPQGTLFGRNSTGGAIQFQTANPDDKLGGYMLGRYGNHDSKYVEGAVSIPLGDKAALRVAGAYTGGGAFVKNLANGQYLGDKDIKSIRGTLVLRPVEGLTNTTVVQHTDEGGNNIPTMLYSAYPCGGPPVNGYTLNSTADCTYGPSNPTFESWLADHPNIYPGGVAAYAALQRKLGPWIANTEVPPFHRAHSTFIINTTNYALSPTLTLKNIIGYSQAHSDDGFDYDGTPYPIFTTAGTPNASATSLLNPKGFDQGEKQFSEEFQIQGKAFDNRLDYVVGGYFLNHTYNILSNLFAFDFSPIALGETFAYQARQTDHSRAVFAQGTYKATDKLSLTGGIRYTWDRLMQVQGPQSAYTFYYGPSPQQISASKPSWTVSLDYQLNPNLLFYVTNRGSWRTGGFNYSTPPLSVGAAQGGDIFNPETTKDVEIGMKYSGRDLGVPVTFNVAAYNQWVNNVQRAAYVPGFAGPGLVTVNVPAARIRGVEADLTVRPVPWLTFGAAGAYTDARYTQNVVTLYNPVAKAPFNTNYGPFADTPKWTGSLYFEVSHELSGDAGKLILHGDVYAQSSFSFSNVGATLSPGAVIKSYALVNGRLSWNDMIGTKISAAFYVRNLLNKKYYTGGNPVGPTLGLNTSVSGEPRMFGGELRFDF